VFLWEIYNNEDFHIFYITFGKSENLMTMKRLVLLLALLLMVPAAVSAQDDYAKRKADGYIREAESYQSKADSYRREAQSYLNDAARYLREMEYYKDRNDLGRAQTQQKYADQAFENCRTKLRYAAEYEDKAAQYLRWAADALRK
jgi:uncharacterized protein YxeA